MIQPLAYIHPQAKIAPNVTVEPFSVIHKDVEISEGTWIGSNVTIMDGARIGKNCRIYSGAVISAPPQDLKYRGEPSTVTIGDNTTIRECVTLNRGTALDKNTTTIGSNCLLMAYVHVAHDCVIGNNVIIANSAQLAGHINVYDHAYIGGTVAIHQFVEIGTQSMVSGGSLVRKDVPPYTKAGREPLSYIGINSVGLRRREYPAATINEIQEIYRIIFLKKYNVTKALDIIGTEFAPTIERDQIIHFVANSQRGIMKGFGI
jgi:UDP-N-acetylglucosamine acyltransferase